MYANLSNERRIIMRKCYSCALYDHNSGLCMDFPMPVMILGPQPECEAFKPEEEEDNEEDLTPS